MAEETPRGVPSDATRADRLRLGVAATMTLERSAKGFAKICERILWEVLWEKASAPFSQASVSPGSDLL